MQAAVTDPMIGRVLEGRYRLRDRLARGGMSVVYLATDQRLERDVAVKVMTGTLSADPAFTDRFAREARAAARLTHLNVVSVYDQGDDAGHVFLVMELVRGVTVRDLITRRAPMPVALAVSVMEPVLAALSAAHRAGLVHRDVKPENILLSDDGLVKVADFGLARAVEADPTSTRTGLMMGTVAYCSPEHVTSGNADARSDVYSAGIVLFELLVGSVPYSGDSAVAVAYQHVHSRVPAPSSRVRGVPEQLDDLVIRATDPDPACRPADAGAFLAELHELRAELGIPITALPVNSGAAARALAPPGRSRPGRGPAGPGTDRAPGRSGTPVPRAPADNPTTALDPRASATTASLRAVGGAGAATGAAGHVVGALPTRSWAVGATESLSTPEVEWNGGWGPGPPPSAHPLPAALQAALPAVGSGPADEPSIVANDWPQRRKRRRRRGLAVLLVLLVAGALIGYGSWWYAAGRWAAVPDVVGQPVNAASTALQAAGFAVSGAPEQVYDETVPVGTVVRTDPDPGHRRVRGQSVLLVVSRGAERFLVPSTQGLTRADAGRALSTIPVAVTTIDTANDNVPAGIALGTTPPVGAEVKRNSTVTLSVSSGPPSVAVPQLVGKSQADAAAAVKAAGFAIAVGPGQFSDTAPLGTVLTQSPADGTAVKFSTITVVVSKGPDLVTIPSISNGTPVATAQATLEAAGVAVTVQKRYGGLLGIVVGMDPKAGEQVKRGSTVTLTSV